MPTMKLTAPKVKALTAPPGVERVVIHDTDPRGLYLQVFASGLKTFGCWYRVRGTGRAGRLTLGRYAEGVYDLADARDDARDALHQARKGNDPAAAKRRDRKAGTFGKLADSFFEAAGPEMRPRTLKEWRALIDHPRLAGLRGMALPTIGRGDIVKLLDQIAKAAPISANRTFEAIRRIFSWGMAHDHVQASPCVGIAKPSKERKRQRFYSDDELQAIIRALDASAMSDAIRLALLTGVRIQQALGAPWSEFDLERGLWKISGARTGTKNRLDWIVPLSTPALALVLARRLTNVIDAIRKRAPSMATTEWLFPARHRKGDDKFGPSWRQQRIISVIREASGIADFRPHDLRRTLTTWLASRGIAKETRDAVLGHVPPGLEGVYNVYDHAEDKRAALERWATHIERLLSGTEKKVVPITGSRV